MRKRFRSIFFELGLLIFFTALSSVSCDLLQGDVSYDKFPISPGFVPDTPF